MPKLPSYAKSKIEAVAHAVGGFTNREAVRIWPAHGTKAHQLCSIAFGKRPLDLRLNPKIFEKSKIVKDVKEFTAEALRFWFACHFASAYFNTKPKQPKGWPTGDIIACQRALAKLRAEDEADAAEQGRRAAGGFTMQLDEEE